MKEWRKEIELNASNLEEYVAHLTRGVPGDYADNDGDREVMVVDWHSGRYSLRYKGECLNETNNVFAALWYLKTGEWVARDGRMYIDDKLVASEEKTAGGKESAK